MWEPEQTPDTPITLTERYILEEFMLEEEIEVQSIGKCKLVELPDDQEIHESVVNDLVEKPDLSIKFIEEQEIEESIKEEVSDIFYQKYTVQKKVYIQMN